MVSKVILQLLEHVTEHDFIDRGHDLHYFTGREHAALVRAYNKIQRGEYRLTPLELGAVEEAHQLFEHTYKPHEQVFMRGDIGLIHQVSTKGR